MRAYVHKYGRDDDKGSVGRIRSRSQAPGRGSSGNHEALEAAGLISDEWLKAKSKEVDPSQCQAPGIEC